MAKVTHPIGAIKEFGGRSYIKTTSGWKYHKKGGGAKAQEHKASTTGAKAASKKEGTSAGDIESVMASLKERGIDAEFIQENTPDTYKRIKFSVKDPLNSRSVGADKNTKAIKEELAKIGVTNALSSNFSGDGKHNAVLIFSLKKKKEPVAKKETLKEKSNDGGDIEKSINPITIGAGEPGKTTLSPKEHQELIKSRILNSIGGEALSQEELTKSASDYFEKAKKAAVVGEKRTWGGKEYIKEANGWKPVTNAHRGGGHPVGEGSVIYADGVAGKVTMHDGKHAMIEHKDKDGNIKHTKVPMDHLHKQIEEGKFKHEAPVDKVKEAQEKKEQQASKKKEPKQIGTTQDGKPIYENVNKNMDSKDKKGVTSHDSKQFKRIVNGVGGWGGDLVVHSGDGKKVDYEEIAKDMKPGETKVLYLTDPFARKVETVKDDRGRPVFYEQRHKTTIPVKVIKDEKGKISYQLNHDQKSEHDHENPKVTQNSWDKEEGRTPIDVKDGKIIYKEDQQERDDSKKDDDSKKEEKSPTRFDRGDEVKVGKWKMTVVGYIGDRLKVKNAQGENFILSAAQTEKLHKKSLYPKDWAK